MDVTNYTPVAFKEILVATDLSDESTKALRYAAAIAKHFQAHLKLIHVSKPPNPAGAPGNGWYKEDIAHEAEQMETLGNSLRGDGLSADAVNAVGKVKAELIAHIEKDLVDLVVLGTHGKKGLERLLFGSEAEDLARRIHCPVLAVGPSSRALDGGEWSLKRILCATSTDHEHWTTVEYAYSLARVMRATLTIVTVRRPQNAAPDDGGLQSASSTQSISISESAHFHIRCDLEDGEPVSAITRVARERSADLIVMGARRAHWPVSHFGRGVLAGIYASAPCPVLTIQVQ